MGEYVQSILYAFMKWPYMALKNGKEKEKNPYVFQKHGEKFGRA